MRRVTKEGTKKEKKVRARADAVAGPEGTSMAAEPAEAPAAEPETETTTVAPAEVPTGEAPLEVPAPVESAPSPSSGLAPEEAAPSSIEVATCAEVGSDAQVTAEQKDAPTIDLDALRKPVEEAKASLDAAEADARMLRENARLLVSVARDGYRAALAPYREACRKAGRACAFEGGRGANVAARVGFLVERTDDGVCITIRGRPETMEVLPFGALKESVGKAALAYTDKHIGPKAEIGNKSGGLGNRIRAVLK